MSLPTLRALLQDLDRTTHADRCRTVASLAAEHRSTPGLAALLGQVEQVSDYHARLVTIAAQVSGDTERLRRLAGHPTPAVARCARRALPMGALPHDDAVALYLSAPAMERRAVRRRLTAAGRTDVVDTLVVDGGLSDRERAGLLGAASDAVVRRHLEDLGSLVSNVEALARRHPAALLDRLAATSTDTPVPERDWWWGLLAGALPVLAQHDPDRLLEVLESRGDGLPWSLHRRLRLLIRHDPARVAALVLATPYEPGWALDRGVLGEARRFAERDCQAIARYLRAQGSHPRQQDTMVAAFLDELAPSLRAATFAAAYEGVSLAERELTSDLLEALPHAERHTQARRMLGLRDVHEAVEHSAYLSGFLPPDEADGRLAAVARSSVADERAAAHAARLRAAARARDPQAMTRALARLGELRNEQDPVRALAAQALITAPVEPVMRADLEPLERFTREVATARDTSPATLSALVTSWWRIALAAVASGHDDVAGRSLAMLLELHEPHGRLSVPSLTGLPRGRERIVVDALLPRLQAGKRRDEPHLLFGLCRALGERAWAHQDLQGMLEKALRVRSSAVVSAAATLWLDDRQARARRVDAALRVDESLATLPLVQHILCTSRQDLLDVLWRAKPLKGRLWGKRMRFVPLLRGPFGRWLPRQVDAYAAALRDLIATPDTPTWTRMQVVRTLGCLPTIGTAALDPFLASDHVALQEAALGALAHTDRPGDALPRLLAVCTGDRARVAMYAVGRCARHLPEAQVWPALLEVLDDPAAKVTARKEAIRLLGALRAPEAVDRVVAVGLADDTHRDVRLAAGRALLAHLDDPRAWQVLERVSGSGRDGALSVQQAQPRQIAARHRAAYGSVLAGQTGVPGLEAVAALHPWVPWLPDAGALLTGRVRDLSWPTWQGTLLHLRALLRHGRGWPDVHVAAAAMADAAESAEGQTDGDGRHRDLPQRQRLAAMVASVTEWSGPDLARQAPGMRGLREVLEARPDTLGMALHVASRTVDWAAAGDDLAALVAVAGDPLRSGDLREAVAEATAQHPGDPTPQTEAAVDRLLADGTVPAAAVALGVVAWAGDRTGWSRSWRARLATLRRHPSAVVASWARDVVTAPE